MDGGNPGAGAVRAMALAAVRTQLSRLGYEASAANAGTTSDLVARSPGSGATFSLKVHGLRRPNGWIVKLISTVPNLYYALVIVPVGAASRFFIMSQREVLDEIERQRIRLDRSLDYRVQGFNFSTGERYEDRWSTLPR